MTMLSLAKGELHIILDALDLMCRQKTHTQNTMREIKSIYAKIKSIKDVRGAWRFLEGL